MNITPGKLRDSVIRAALLAAVTLSWPAYCNAGEPWQVGFGAYSTSKVVEVTPSTAGLEDDLVVKVDGLPQLLDAAAKADEHIVLFLNGMALKEVYPDAIYADRKTLTFHLRRTEGSRNVWNKLLGRPRLSWTRPADVSVGLENGYPIHSSKRINLINIRQLGLLFWLVFFCIIFYKFLHYTRNTAMLRNFGPGSTYSLAWTHMAFWFCLVIVSYAFIWLVTGEVNCIPESVLVLLGIGAGTALGARVIDASKEGKDNLREATLRQQRTLLGRKVQLLAQPSTAEIQQMLNQVQKELEVSSKILTPPSRGFLNDILNDEDGVSLHRMQMVAWTLVLGIIFIVGVYRELSMPEFDATLLALIGISSGTYLGFKFPEQTTKHSKELPEQEPQPPLLPPQNPA